MPITVVWDNEAKTIIRWDYVGKWKWSEATYGFEDTIRMMHEVQHPVSLIHDLTQSAGIPGSALTNAYRFTSAGGWVPVTDINKMAVFPQGWVPGGVWCSCCRLGGHSVVTSVTAVRALDSSTMFLSAANAATRAWRARLLTARG